MIVLWRHLAFSWNREQWPCELIHARPVVRTHQKALWSVFFSSTIFFICFFSKCLHQKSKPTTSVWISLRMGSRSRLQQRTPWACIRESRFPCEKSMNLLTPIDGFGMPSLWFQSCWISPSYFLQLSKYRENWVRIYLYFDHLRNSKVPSTLLGVVFFSF